MRRYKSPDLPHEHDPPSPRSSRETCASVVQPSLVSSNVVQVGAHSSIVKSHCDLKILPDDASPHLPKISSDLAAHDPECDEVKSQFLSNFTPDIIAMASSGSSARSEDAAAAPMSAQQPSADRRTDSSAHSMKSSQTSRCVDDLHDETQLNHSQSDEIIHSADLSRYVHKLPPLSDSKSPEPSNRQLGNYELQDQTELVSEHLRPHHYFEDSAQVAGSHTPTRPTTTREASIPQLPATSMYASSPHTPIGSGSEQVASARFSQRFMNADPFQRQLKSQLAQSTQPIQGHRLALKLMNSHPLQLPTGLQPIQESYDHLLNQDLTDTNYPTFAQNWSFKDGGSLKLPQLPAQVGYQEIQDAYKSQLARISMNTPQPEFSQAHEPATSQLEQVPINIAPIGPPSDNRPLNPTPRNMRRSRTKWEFPRTQEALDRQMALLAMKYGQNCWPNEQETEIRPPGWSQSRQNFGIFQRDPSQPPGPHMASTSTTNSPQMCRPAPSPRASLEPDGQYGFHKSIAPQGWPGSHNEGARAEPRFCPLFPKTVDEPFQTVTQAYTQPVAKQENYQHGQLDQLGMLPAPRSTGRMPYLAGHIPAAASTSPSSGLASKTQLYSDRARRAALEGVHTKVQPPIGTPRALPRKSDYSDQSNQSNRAIVEVEVKVERPIQAGLAYYPGSDLMFPYAKDDPSEALRILTINGRPSIDELMDGNIVPFVKNEGESNVADWGVIRIGNVSQMKSHLGTYLPCTVHEIIAPIQSQISHRTQPMFVFIPICLCFLQTFIIYQAVPDNYLLLSDSLLDHESGCAQLSGWGCPGCTACPWHRSPYYHGTHHRQDDGLLCGISVRF